MQEKRFYAVEKVILTPKSEHSGWTINRDYDTWTDEFTTFAGGDLIFDASEWEWEIEYTRTQKFRKVVELIGDADTAEKILDALGES